MILVFNAGSSSLKFQLYRLNRGQPVRLLRGVVRVAAGQASCDWVFQGERDTAVLQLDSHAKAAAYVLERLAKTRWQGQPLLAGVGMLGHRIVHGGDSFSRPALIDEPMLAVLEELSRLAPLHNPPALEVIHQCRRYLGNRRLPMVAVFDTAYFQSLPGHARAYALPARWQQIKRFGFHGLAHRSLAEQCVMLSGLDPGACRLISLQLGHGCSAAAVRNGRPLDTSMGYTPLEGLVMATRPGDVDAGAVLALAAQPGVVIEELEKALNTEAGLLGLSGVSADMRTLLQREQQGHAGAGLAIQAFCHRVRKYIGAYLAVLGGADAIVFGGGIGERSPQVRARICDGMQWCGIALDPQANQEPESTAGLVSRPGSRPMVYVVEVDEELLIAQDTLECITAGNGNQSG